MFESLSPCLHCSVRKCKLECKGPNPCEKVHVVKHGKDGDSE